MLKDDPVRRVLHIDLSNRRSWTVDRPELFDKYLGGSGVAIKLLTEECPAGASPLGEENPIILAIGQLNGLFPSVSKTVAMFKSPLTGNLGESHAGGRTAISIRMAGYGAIVIKGSSETPVYLVVDNDGVRFKDASGFWGIDSSYIVGRTIRERESGAGVRSIMRIGRAGEKQVSYACLVTETYRHFGRLGLGAVFGSKKLKALVVSGSRSLKFKDPKLYRETYNELFKALTTLSSMKKYHDLGTPMNVGPLNALGAFPTRNLTSNRFEAADKISGEAFCQGYLGRRVACAHCPVSCIHIAALREPYEGEPYFYKTRMISYDYELIYSLGSMLGVGSPENVLRLIDETERYGLDAISTGVALAWATEMLGSKMISEDDAMGLRMRWGDAETYLKAVKLITSQPNDFFRALAKGVDYAASRYGGEEFGLTFGRNEMAGYSTGPATYIANLVGSRHSHLDAAGYGIDEKAVRQSRSLTSEEIARELLNEEIWRQVLSSMVVCYFARGVYTPDMVVKAFRSVEYEFTQDDLKLIGSKILKAKYAFKVREGFDLDKLSIPKRILEVDTPYGKLSEEFIEETIQTFKRKIESLPL
jgi:aldehyde:ferredoxin oxidoreductase